MPMPPNGQALTDPFYVAERFTAALGATPVRERVFTSPPPGAIVVLSAWHWTLDADRQRALERWVESGGRLVVDDSLVGGEREFERWSGIARRLQDGTGRRAVLDEPPTETCSAIDEELPAVEAGSPARAARVLCDVDEPWMLTSSRPALWSLQTASGVQTLRVGVGRGSV